MHAKKIKHTNILVLEQGEELVSALLDYCSRENIQSAWISGLGAISSAKLAFYHLSRKEYQRQEMNGSFELLNLNGNIGRLGNKTIAHLHATLSNDKMNAYGGHLDEAVVAATCEVRIEEMPIEITRKFSEEIGLNLIERN